MVKDGEMTDAGFLDKYDELEYEQLRIYPTVKRYLYSYDSFVAPDDAVMTEELLAYTRSAAFAKYPSDDADAELRARWVDKLEEGFARGEQLALETLALAARRKGNGAWAVGRILRAAIETEYDVASVYVARGFIHTIVSAAISGRSALARRKRKTQANAQATT